MNKKGKKKFSFIDLFVKLVIFAGICLLFYPTVSNKWNEFTSTQILAGYAHAVENFTEEDYTAILETAQAYNETLQTTPDRFKPDDDALEEYYQILNITGDGLMASVEIPKINVKMPIYHTVTEEVLQVAAGHIPGSSVPIGGPGTHSAISGHTGMTSAQLFTHLNQLELGDMFYIHCLNQTMAYQVDQIDIVLPTEFDLLKIDKNEDYCTLITCTPYGVNSHRLLVRGTRVEYQEDVKEEIIPIERDDWWTHFSDTTLYIGCTSIAIIIAITIKNGIKKYRKRKRFERRFTNHNAKTK